MKFSKMRLLKQLERPLLVLGLVLLAFYTAATVHRIVLSRASVRQFEALKRPLENNPSDRPQLQQEMPQPDFVLWSEKRIQGYEQSLDHQLAPPLAILRIPSINLEAPVLEGTDDLTLNRGIGRIAGTSRLGTSGNIGLAGHRDGFFRGLKDIHVGDTIDLEASDRTETYVVDHLQIVDPSNIDVLRPTSKPGLTLVTCYPFYFIGSAPKRYIVHASRQDSTTSSNIASAHPTPVALNTSSRQ